MPLPQSRLSLVECWYLKLDARLLLSMQDCLSDAEKTRAQAFKFPLPRDQFVFFRGALRFILAGAFGLPLAFRISASPAGKPMLPDYSEIGFNLSHSHEHGLIACGRDCAIGVDIEKLEELPDLHGLAQRVFSPEEYREFAEDPNPLQRFYSLWTRKEAYSKVSGRGLSMPFQDIGSDAGKIFLRRGTQRADEMTYLQLDGIEGAAACAVLDPGRSVARYGNADLEWRMVGLR